MYSGTVFKSTEGRDRIRARYSEILASFPFRQNYVDTSFGRTFVLESGEPNGPPLILLHGSCSNSAFWFYEISMLSSMYRVLAVDIIGEAGNSDEKRPLLASDGYADWLMDVFSALSIKKAVIAGNSLGGWVALKFSAKYPELVIKLILIAASGLSPVNSDFLDRVNSTADTLDVDAAVTGEIAMPKEVLEFISLILQGFNPIKEDLPILTDEQLDRLTMPSLYVAGKDDRIVDTLSSSKRLKERKPGAQIHLLDNTGHMVLNALEYMIPFLTQGN